MRRLRPTDGTPVHRRAARYHISKCTLGTAPLHQALVEEMSVRYAALVAAARTNEDAEDAATAADAVLDAAEVQFENVIRDLDSELAQLDRARPDLGAQTITFPEGYGAVIEPDGDDQLKELGPLRIRVAPFKDEPPIAAVLARLDLAAESLEKAIKAADAAEAKADATFAEEGEARAAIRQQMESAYGRLRDLYKARPALAETFFLKETGRRRSKKEPQLAGSAPAAPPASPATPA